jgi:hypothetical protein
MNNKTEFVEQIGLIIKVKRGKPNEKDYKGKKQ